MKKFVMITAIVLTSFFGCDSLMRNSELPKMTNEELKSFFITNQTDLQEIVDICEEYPTIKRIEKDRVVYYEDLFSDSASKAVNRAQTIVDKLKIFCVECSRSHIVLDNQLMGASFCLYSAGLGVSGEGQSIVFDTKRFRDDLAKENRKKANIPWRTIFPLPEEGWSIVHTK